jgi:opacity protein-like surface antigen
MTRNFKALGLALLAICALGAVVAQGASAAEDKHKFHSDGPNTVITGKAIGGNHTFAVGTAGTVECTSAEFESTQTGTEVGVETYSNETLTVVPHYSGCTFGGQPATVTVKHCAYIFYGQTTPGNSDGGEHANVEIECEGEGGRIEIDTTVCTITVGGQLVKHAVRYENDPESTSAVKIKATAKKIVTGKVKTTESQTGCLLFPTGEIGTYKGTVTSECFKDEGSAISEKTAKTTPTGLTKEGKTTKCTVSPGGLL